MTDHRPDPDALLEELKREEEAARRGRLKIFFGACAGVGKTYAMLAAAHARIREGCEVVVGIAETHGRSETAALLVGLEVLPLKQIEYKGRKLPEFDLDGALTRQPALILVDELAHSNIEGSRHPKRWQDVEELLAAGIDVYTTLNVQHLESLNDIVGQITGIVVRETLPDNVFDAADDVTLVDLPPDELLARLRAGKVYMPHQAERAARNFFRKGNLLALRELALRRTADRVDAQMRAYRADQSIQPVWQTRERLLVCVGPGASAEKLVRSASRLAASLHADWIAVYIETPALQRLPGDKRDRILKILKLALELGAETCVLAGAQLPATLLAYARSRNVSKIVVGKSLRSGLSRLWKTPLSEQLAQQTEDVDVFVVAHDFFEREEEAPQKKERPDEETGRRRRIGFLASLGGCTLTTLITAGLLNYFDLANVVMLYLLTVVLLAIRFGREAGIASSILSVLAFDFFFVPPRFTFAVADTQYLFTFAVMLAVALIISQLAARLRFEATVATHREQRTRALYDLGQELASALTVQQIVEIGMRHLDALLQSQVVLLIPDSGEQLRPASAMPPRIDIGIAQWVFDHQQAAGHGTNTLPASPALYIPVKAPMRTRGVLAILTGDKRSTLLPEQHRLLETCAAQIALALERVHYVEVAQDAVVAMESERLRNSVLSTVSHDLRTPLTSLVGLTSLLEKDELPPGERKEIAGIIRHETQRMSRMVTNLLDMARLQSGIKLNKEWQLLEEVVGSAAHATERSLAGHLLSVDIPPELPMVEIDVTLIERVLVNLLENAGKYTPPGSTITISARVESAMLAVSVDDNGPGLPAGMDSRIFDKFTRGVKESTTPGIGLGLAICRTIVEAHGGKITAKNRVPHGAAFTFTLPLGNPPTAKLEQ